MRKRVSTMRHKNFNQIFGNVLIGIVLGFFVLSHTAPALTFAQVPDGTCSDKKDNDGDGRIDWNGGNLNGTMVPPDPACINAQGAEYADDVTSKLIPCTNKCDLGSLMQLINNLITFLIKVILFPITVLMFVYAGYQYITAQGNPSKKANVKKMLWHLVGGIVLILCAWLIVKTLLVVLGYTDRLYFFE